MTANAFKVVTLIFPNPHNTFISGSSFNQLNNSISFEYDLPSTIRTLSSNNASPGNDLTGLLYLPLLNSGDSCNAVIPQYTPVNVTTQNNLPNTGQFAFLAIAPWINSTCTLQYLNAASDDSLRAFIFYLPNTGSDTPGANDPAWDLGDNGAWKSNAKFPVYAIDGQSGDTIMRELSLYSGNLTTVPNGSVLASQFPPSFYVRLAGTITIDDQNSLPSLWIFLLIVLGILIFIIGFTSCSMHLIQRRRRELLRRRVVSGEIDLEQLGIKRLTVPRSILDTMPVYTYPDVEKIEMYARPGAESPVNSEEEIQAAEVSQPQVTPEPAEKVKETIAAETIAVQPKEKKTATTTTRQPQTISAASQPTCAICLEDFISLESTVRELPCKHIFHADCIDPFLRENSSLCPLCKKTSLPKGFCPPVITNAMVRRERMMRRTRTRAQRQQAATTYPWWNPMRWVFTIGRLATIDHQEASNPNRIRQRWEQRRWPGTGVATEISRRARRRTGTRNQNGAMEDVELGQATSPDCAPNPTGSGVLQQRSQVDSSHPEVLTGANQPISEEITATNPEQPVIAKANTTTGEEPETIATASEGQQPVTVASPTNGEQQPVTQFTEPIALTIPIEDDEPPRPRWRRALSVVWPGLV